MSLTGRRPGREDGQATLEMVVSLTVAFSLVILAIRAVHVHLYLLRTERCRTGRRRALRNHAWNRQLQLQRP